jgi:hypothetical protein
MAKTIKKTLEKKISDADLIRFSAYIESLRAVYTEKAIFKAIMPRAKINQKEL